MKIYNIDNGVKEMCQKSLLTGVDYIHKAKNLNGKLYSELNEQEKTIFQLMVQQGRKYGVVIKIENEAKVSDMRNLSSYTAEQWDSYLLDKQGTIQVICENT